MNDVNHIQTYIDVAKELEQEFGYGEIRIWPWGIEIHAAQNHYHAAYQLTWTEINEAKLNLINFTVLKIKAMLKRHA